MWNDYGGNINAYELRCTWDGTIYADISGNDGSYSASRSTTTEVKERSIGLKHRVAG